MEVNLKKITTEGRNPETYDIDVVSTLEIVQKINNEDQKVALTVKDALPSVAEAVDAIVETFKKGGRLIYVGAGTSGRIGLMDAVECPPTYGVKHDMVMCIMAGGMGAMEHAVEGAEDDALMGEKDLKNVNVSSSDIVIGIAASGRTPYVIGAIEYAKKVGTKTGCIVTSKDSPLAKLVDYPIEAITGPEAITGSTRMKAGTAQKLICNMLSTASMVKMGKVYENLMIDVQATNIKLVSRAVKIIMDITGLNELEARQMFENYGNVKRSVFASLTSISNINEIDYYLNKNNGNLRGALEEAKSCNK